MTRVMGWRVHRMMATEVESVDVSGVGVLPVPLTFPSSPSRSP